MNRRSLFVGFSCVLLPLSGCVRQSGTNGGLLEVLETEAHSAATVTPSNDKRIHTVEPIQTALDRASEKGTADLQVDKSEFDNTANALTQLPWYERKDDYPSGIYLRHEGSTYVASLWPYCTNSVFGSAESERGIYGRGGCLNPEKRPGNTLTRES